MIAQEPLDQTVATVEKSAANGGDWAGFSGIEEFPETKLVVMTWARGFTVPQTVLNYVAGRDALDTMDMRLDTSGAYTYAQLEAAADQVETMDEDAFGVTIQADGSGLVVERTATASSGSRRTAPNPYVVAYENSADAPKAMAYRQNDTASGGWSSGARIRIGNLRCSSGFGVTVSGTAYLVTANHCAPGNGARVTDGNGDSIGYTARKDLTHEVIGIEASSVSGLMYHREWNNTNGPRERVVGTVSSGKGSYVCTSGSFTGTNCDLKIISGSYRYKIEDNIWRRGVRAERQSNNRAVGNGDSGGPVLKNTSTAGNIKAAGIISAGQTRLDSCGGNADNTTCYRKVIYMQMSNADLGGSVITN